MSKFPLQSELLPHCSNLSSWSRQKWTKRSPEQMLAERFIGKLAWFKHKMYKLISLQLLFRIIRVCCRLESVCQSDRAPRSMREMQGNKTAACVTQPCYGSHFFKLMSSSFLLTCSKKLLNHKRQSSNFEEENSHPGQCNCLTENVTYRSKGFIFHVNKNSRKTVSFIFRLHIIIFVIQWFSRWYYLDFITYMFKPMK